MKLYNNISMALALPLVVGSICTSAQATIYTYDAVLSGAAESPPNASAGTGFAEVDYDSVLHSLEVQVTFSGLTGTTTASHIHAATPTPGTGTAGVATTLPYFAGFPIGVTSGSYSNTLDLTAASSWNPSYVTANGGTTAGAELALFNALQADEAYLNIHSTFAPGGEIRGFLVAVPEPGTMALIGLGLGAVAWRKRKNH